MTQHYFPTITLRNDAFEAILKQIDGRALSEIEKYLVRVAYHAIKTEVAIQGVTK